MAGGEDTPDLPISEFYKARDAFVRMLQTISYKCPGSAMQMTVYSPTAVEGRELHYNVELPNMTRAQVDRLTPKYMSAEEFREEAETYFRETGLLEKARDRVNGVYQMMERWRDGDDFVDNSHKNGLIPRVVATILKSDHVDPALKDFIRDHYEGTSGNSLWFDRDKNPSIKEIAYMTISFKRPAGEEQPVGRAPTAEEIKSAYEKGIPADAEKLTHRDFSMPGYDLMAELILATQQLSDAELRHVFHPKSDALLCDKVSDTLNKDIAINR